MDVVHGFLDVLLDRELSPVVLVILNDAYDAQDLVPLGNDRVLACHVPRGNALWVQKQFHNSGGWLAAGHNVQVVAPIFFGQAPGQQVKVRVADQFRLGLKLIQFHQVLIGCQQYALVVFGEKRQILDAVKKPVKRTFRAHGIEQGSSSFLNFHCA